MGSIYLLPTAVFTEELAMDHHTTHDLPSGQAIEAAWRGVEAALRTRRRITVVAANEELACSPM